MATSPKVLHRSTLPNASAPQSETVPAGKRWVITNVIFSNYSTISSLVTMTLGGVSLINAMQLAPGAVFTLDCTQVLEAGGTFTINADASGRISAHVSGVEMDV